MKLLMITRKVDRQEHLAGFIYNWVKKLAGEVDELRVISWQEGDSSGLPGNVKVTHLKTKQNKLAKIGSFKKAVWKNLKGVDGVFCHQMPIYTIIAAPLAKVRGKKVVSWYTHRQVNFKMRLMEKLADVVLSASPESFRLKSKKLVITGHGIDVDIFNKKDLREDFFRIISVGRISPAKNYETMLQAISKLQESNFSFKIIGSPGLKRHVGYLDQLKELVKKLKVEKHVFIDGQKPNSEIPQYLQQSDVFINLSDTGSLDKAVLEAMSCGCIVLTSNEAFKEILPQELMVEKDNPKMLVEKIKMVMNMPTVEQESLRERLRQIVVVNHNLDNLVKKIARQYGKTS